MDNELCRNWLVRVCDVLFCAIVHVCENFVFYCCCLLQNRELNGDDLLTKHRALMSLCDILHDPENISQALRVGKIKDRDWRD
jgi:hypothetical protein